MWQANDQLLLLYRSAFNLTLDCAIVCLLGLDSQESVSEEAPSGNGDASPPARPILTLEMRDAQCEDWACLPIPWLIAYWSGWYGAAWQHQAAWLADAQGYSPHATDDAQVCEEISIRAAEGIARREPLSEKGGKHGYRSE